MPRVTLDASKWLRGASVANTLANGGFSPSFQGVDLFRKPGCIAPGASNFGGAAITNMLANGVLAWFVPKQVTGSDMAYVLTANSSNDGRIVTLDGFGAATIIMASDTGRDYVKGYSDLIQFKGETFATSRTDLAIVTGPDYTYWTVTLGLTAFNTFYPHYMCEFEDELYILDGRYVHKFNGSAGTYNALDLPEDYVGSAICKYNGRLWIAAEPYQTNTSGTLHGRASLFVWDGFSASWEDEKVLNERVDSMIVNRGVLFMTTRKTFGYWNGSAFVDLYQLPGQVLKHQITAVRDRIVFAPNSNYVVCYGNPIPGKQRFFSFPQVEANGAIWDSVLGGWNDDLRKFSGINAYNEPFPATASTVGNDCSHLEDPILFNDYVKITRVTVVLDNAVASGENIAISYVNSDGDTVSVGSITNTDHSGRREIVFDVENDKPAYFIQPKYTWVGGANATGIRYVHIDYEPAEDRPTK